MLPVASRLSLTYKKLTTKQTAEVLGKEKPGAREGRRVAGERDRTIFR